MIGCKYCLRVNGHAGSCPNYEETKSKYICSICNEGIRIGEEYIVNDGDDYAHWECVDYARDLAKFLGCKIKEMDDDEY